MKENIKRMKRQTANWEKIFAEHKSNKGLVTGLHFKNS